MCSMQKKICLIVPCYNEEKRIDFKKFNAMDSLICYVFVNDGSSDNTLDLLNENINNFNCILDLKKNVGKAEATRQGILFLKTLPFFEKLEWVGYWDADMATPISEVENFIKYTNFYESRIDAIYGSRMYRLGSTIKRDFLRHILGRFFATVVALLFKIKSYDSQCGAKLFRRSVIEVAFADPFISKWIFDVEILLRLRNLNVIEYPLKEWCDVKGSKIKILPVAGRLLLDFVRMYRKYILAPKYLK